VTAAFDARGRLLAWMGQSSRGVVTVRIGLPAASARTVYDRFGDYVPWSALAVVVLSALVMFANSRGFPGRRAGAKRGDEAQYVAGQSVPSLARSQGKANLVYKEARCPRMVFCMFIPRPRRCARTLSGP